MKKFQDLIVGTNGMSAREIFEARQAYNTALRGSGKGADTYTLWDVGRYYGFVDKRFNTININGKFKNLADTGVPKELAVPERLTFGLNFVVDAFREFSTYYGVLADSGKISTKQTTLVNLIPSKGIVSTLYEHELHI